MIFDSHCHLGLDGVPADDEHRRAFEAGVTEMLVVGIDLSTTAAARELGERLEGIRWSAGLHPNRASRFADEWAGVEALARTPGCGAIGETGLDFYRDRAPRPMQETALRAHLELARSLDLPVVIHCREAFAELFSVLADFAPLPGVLHCFSGGPPEAERALELGLWISFAGPLTYGRNGAIREACARVPGDRLLVETDAPFLPPEGFRGRRNEVAMARVVLERIAAIRGWSIEEAADRTTANARALFDREIA
ncbi:MAG: TatD family hydrolase [Planctomycetota bacterium]